MAGFTAFIRAILVSKVAWPIRLPQFKNALFCPVVNYAGIEQVQANFFSATTGLVGFGVPTATNFGCDVGSFTGGTSNRAAINRQVSSVTAGF